MASQLRGHVREACVRLASLASLRRWSSRPTGITSCNACRTASSTQEMRHTHTPMVYKIFLYIRKNLIQDIQHVL